MAHNVPSCLLIDGARPPLQPGRLWGNGPFVVPFIFWWQAALRTGESVFGHISLYPDLRRRHELGVKMVSMGQFEI